MRLEEILLEAGYTPDEVEEIIDCVECGMSLDCAMQRLGM